MESSQAADLNRETERFRNLTLDEILNVKIDKINRENRRGGTILIEPLYHLQAPEKRTKRKKKKKPSTDDGTEGDVETKQSSHVPTFKTKKAHTSQDRESSRDKGSTKPDSGSSGEKATSSRKNQTNQNLSENSTKPNPRGNDKSQRIKIRSPEETSPPSEPPKTRAIRDNLRLLFTYKNRTIPKVKSGENTNQDGSNDDSSSETKMVSPLEGLYPAERLQYGLHVERYAVEELMGRPESHDDVNDYYTDPEQQKNWDFLNKTTKMDEMYKNLTIESKRDEMAAEAKKKERSKTNDKSKTKNAKKELTRPKKPTTNITNKETVNDESERALVPPKPTVSEDRNESLILEENAACPMKIIEVKSISKLMTVAAQKAWNSLKGKKKVGELKRDRKRETTASKSLSSESKKRNDNNDRKKSHNSKSKKSKNPTTTNNNTDQAPESEFVNDNNETLTMGFNAEVNNNSPQPFTSQEETIPDYYDWMNPNYTNDGNMEENMQTLTSVMNIDDDSINDIHATRTGSRDSISTIEIDNSSNSFNAITMNLRTVEPTEFVENVNDNGVYSAFDEGAGHLFQGEDGQGEDDRLFGDEDGSAYYEDEGYNMQMLFGEEDGPKLFAEGHDLFEVEDGPKLFGETGGLIEDEDGPKFFPGPDLFEEEDGPKISAVIGNVIEGAFGTEFFEGAGSLNEGGNDREFRERAENLNEDNDNEEIFRPDEEEESEFEENPNRRLNAMKKKKKKNTGKKKTEKNKKKKKKKLGPGKKKGLKRKGQTKKRVKRKRTAKAKPPIVRIYQTRNRLRIERGLTNLIDLFDEIENELEENVGDTNGADGEGRRQKPKREVQKLREGLYNAFKKRPNNQQSRSPSPDTETESHASDSPGRSDRKRSRTPQGDNQALDIERKRAKTSSDETDNLNNESQESSNEQTSVEASSSHSERHEEEPSTDDSSTRSLNENQDSYVEEGRAHKTPYNLRTFTEAYQKKARKTPYNLRSFTKSYQMRVRRTSYDFRNVLRKYNFLNRTTKRHAARDSSRGYQDSENGSDSRTEGESESRDLDSNGELDEQERAGTEPENEEQDLGAEREPENIPHESNVEEERVFTETENIPHESNVEEERASSETENIPHESNVEEDQVSTVTEQIPLESNVEEERVSTESENENQDLDVRQEQVEREFENKNHAPNAAKKRAAKGSENEEQNLDTKKRTTETVRYTLSVGTKSNIGKKRTQNKAGKKMTGPHKRRRISSVEDANINQSLNLNPKVVLDKLNLKTFDHNEVMSVARDIQSRQRNLMQREQQAKGHKKSQHKKQKKSGERLAWELNPNQGGVSNEKQNEVQNGEDQDKEQDKKAGSAKRMKSFLERNVRKSKRMKFRGSSRGYVGKKLTEACFRAFLPPNSSTAHRKRKSNEEISEEHLKNKKKRVPVRNETATDSETIQWLKSYSLLNYSFRKSQKLYWCMLCPKSSTFITSHYKLIHRESEVLISRLSRKEASDAIADAIAEGIAHEVENKSTQARPQSCVYICRMCDKGKMTTLRDFFEHVITHTGEFNLIYPTGTSTRTLRRSGLAIENTLNSSEPLYGFICSRCHYVQVFRKNVEDHVERKHKEDRNIPIIKINLSSKVPSEETNDVEKNLSTTSGKKMLAEKQQQTEDDAAEVENGDAEVENDDAEVENDDAEVENDDAEVENDDAEVENDDAEVENDDAEVENDDAEVENDDAEVESDDAEVESDDAEVENDDAEVENDDAEVENYAAEVENYAAGVEYYVPRIVYYTAQYCDPEAENYVAVAENYVAEVENGGAEAENYVAEVENGGAEAENYVAEVENGGAEAENYDEEVQIGERVEEESYTPKSPSPEPNRETFELEVNEERAKPNDEPELINIADLPNSPPLVELDVDEEPKLDDVDIKVEYEIHPYRRKWVVGLLKAQILDDSDFLYDCLVKTCMFTTRVYSNFESHVRIMHSNTSWRGNCDACDHKAKPGETLTMLNALEHLTSHSRARRSRNKASMNDNEIVSLEQEPVEDDSNNNTAQNHKASCYYAHECGSELCRHCIRGFCDERCFVIRQPPHGVKTYFCNFCTFKSALKKSMAKHVFSKHSTMMENALLEEKVSPNLDPSSSASNPVDNYQYPLYSKPDQDQPVLQQYTMDPPQTTTLNIVEHNITHDLIPVIPPINFSEPIITEPIDYSTPHNEPLDLSQDPRQSRGIASYPASLDRNFLGEWEPRTEEE